MTGTSVLGIKFKGGVMMAADNLGELKLARPAVEGSGLRSCRSSLLIHLDLPTASYGSLARFKDIVRLHPVGEQTLLGASGDMADFQQVKRLLENLM